MAATARWWLWPDDPLGVTLARDWGVPPADVVPPLSFLPGLWAQSPFAHAALWPAAALGPAAFHGAQAFLAALVAPAAAWAVAAGARVGRGWAVAAGLLAAVHPAVLAAGPGPVALALPLLLLGLAASEAGRHGRAMAMLAAGGAMSVAAALAALPLAVSATVLAARRGQARWWPLQLDLRTTALLWGGLAGLVPAAYAWLVLDVGAVAGEAWAAAALPVAPLALAGLASLAMGAARPWAVAGLGCAALIVPLVAAGIVDAAAFAAPATLLLVAGVVLAAAVTRAVVTLGAAAEDPASGRRSEGGTPTSSGPFGPFAAGAAVAAVVLALAASAGAALPMPTAEASTVEALALVPDEARGNLFVVDLRWQDVAWVAGEVGFLGWAWSKGITDTGPWSAAVEDLADATLLRVDDTRLNEALRQVYGDCVVASGDGHVVIVGRDCKGRGEQLRAAVAGPDG